METCYTQELVEGEHIRGDGEKEAYNEEIGRTEEQILVFRRQSLHNPSHMN